MIGISWWRCEVPSTLGKEITPSFECTLTHALSQRLLLTSGGDGGVEPSGGRSTRRSAGVGGDLGGDLGGDRLPEKLPAGFRCYGEAEIRICRAAWEDVSIALATR